MLKLTPEYEIQALPDGTFTITREGTIFSGNWIFETRAKAAAMIRSMEDDAYYSARAEAAWEDYDRRHGDD